MKTTVTLFLIPILFFSLKSNQSLTGEELLQKSIQYHDPNGNWREFSRQLTIKSTRPDYPDRFSEVMIDNVTGKFKLTQERGETKTEREWDGEKCMVSLNGKTELTEEEIKENRLSCDYVKRMRDYYVYLYGLPMKLKDEGTIIDPEVKKVDFQGKEYWALKVTYDPEVGADTWYFYMNTETYALEGYRFYHEEEKNDGEYITLSGEMEVGGVKIPKDRGWYYNSDNKHLGTDYLTKSQ